MSVENQDSIFRLIMIQALGSPWSDLPAFFGHWSTVFKRYRDWVKADVFIRLFEACSDEPEMEYSMVDASIVPEMEYTVVDASIVPEMEYTVVDASIVKVHRHGQGAKGGLRARP